MHKEVLTKKQIELLPLIKKFKRSFGLVGGTAIALYLGHRESIDFDLFSNKIFKNSEIRSKITKEGYKIDYVFQDNKDEYSILVNGVKLTFLYYPFEINFINKFNDIINLPELDTLGAMKAYALGRRIKWKDYVDLYFISQQDRSLSKIIKKSKEIFKSEFNEKNFKVQLSYFKDIDYTEEVIFKKDFKVDDEKIKRKLREISL
jgi:hypothetical protein